MSSREVEDLWNWFPREIDGEAAIFLVNLGEFPHGPDAKRPDLLWVWVHLRTPNQFGLESPEEGGTLEAIDQRLRVYAKRRANARLVARLTTNGRREYYFYAARPADPAWLDEAMEPFEDYGVEAGAEQDDEWARYFDELFPAPVEMQWMQDRATVQELMRAGDDLSARSVAHLFAFASTIEREHFVREVVGQGFSVDDVWEEAGDDEEDDDGAAIIDLSPVSAMPGTEVEEEDDDEEEEGGPSLMVRISREDSLQLTDITEVTRALFQLCEQYNGEYQGWETAQRGS